MCFDLFQNTGRHFVSDLFLEGGDRGVISRQGIDRHVTRVKLYITAMEGGKEKDKIAGN